MTLKVNSGVEGLWVCAATESGKAASSNRSVGWRRRFGCMGAGRLSHWLEEVMCVTLWDKDQAGGGSRSGPDGFDFGQRQRFGVYAEPALRGMREDVVERAGEDVHRRNACGAEDGERGTAQDGGGEINGGSGGFAHLHQAGLRVGRGELVGGDGRKKGFGRWTPNIVNDDVEAFLRVLLAEGGDQRVVRLMEGDGGIGAERGK